MNMYTCPVCGFKGLWRPPEDNLICPSCGTQFGYTDANRSWAQLRGQWNKEWYSPVFPKPLTFNADQQLRELLGFEDKPCTDASIAIVNLNEKEFNVRPTSYGDVFSISNLLLIGNSGVGTGLARK
jgi:hypothetical protein